TSTGTFQTANTGAAGKPASGDYVFIATGSGTYNGSITPLNNQHFIGQAASASLTTITGFSTPSGTSQLPATGGTAPVLGTTSAADCFTMGAAISAELRGFTIGTTNGFKIASTGFGTLTASELTLNGNGGALNLTNGTLNGTFLSITSGSSAAQGILLNNVGGSSTVSGTTTITSPSSNGIEISGSSGTKTFTGTTSVTKSANSTSGVNINGSTVAFGQLDITATGTVQALTLNGGSVSMTAGTISSVNNAAINASSTALGTSTLTSVSEVPTLTIAGACIGLASTTGSLTVNGGTLNANSSNPAVSVSGAGTFNFTYAGTINQTNSQQVVSVSGKTGGTITFSGPINANTNPTQGISLTNNTGATINFTGGMAISGGSNTAFTATGGGTVSATQNNTSIVNTLTTTTGTALNVTDTIGASGLTFRSISANGAAKGIILNNTGSGAFTVSGNGGLCDATHVTGTDCTGGTIQSASSRGIELTSAQNITLKNMYLKNDGTTAVAQSGATCNPDIGAGDNTACNAALYMNAVTSVSLDRMFLDGGSGTSKDNGINADAVNGFTMTNSEVRNFWANQKDAANIQNPSGTWNIGNTVASPMPVTFDNNREAHNWFITANAGTPNITFTNTTISNSPLSGTGNASGISALARSGSTVNLTADHCTFTSIVSNAVNWGVTAGGNLTAAFSNNTATQVDSIDMTATGNSSTINYTITGNTITTQATTGHSAINVGRGSVAPNGTNMTETGTVTNNNITVNSSTCSTCWGIQVSAEGASGHGATNVSNNTISGNVFNGIRVLANAGGQELNLKMQGNAMTTTQTPANTGYGIDIQSGGGGSDTNCLFLNFGDMSVGHTVPANKNNVNGSWTNGSANKISLAIFDNAHLNLLNYGGGTDAAAGTYVGASNVGGADAFHIGTNGFGSTQCGSPVPAPAIPDGVGRTAEMEYVPRANPLLGSAADIAYEPAVNILCDTGATSEFVATMHPIAVSTEQLPSLIAELLDKLTAGIEPTVEAQKATNGPAAAPIATAPITLPAGSSVTITYQLSVANGPYAAGLNSLSDAASITWTGTPAGSTNATGGTIALDARPSISVANTDSTTEAQPGTTITYAVSATNANIVNGQDATGVKLTETVPANTTFNLTASDAGWAVSGGNPGGCANGAAAGTTCTNTIGAVTANGTAVTKNFAVDVPGNLAATATSIGNTASVADDGANGTNQSANTSQTDTDLVRGLWEGTFGVDWFTPGNWANSKPPTGGNVAISTSAGQDPLVSASNDSIGKLFLNGKDLTIALGQTLTTSSVSLQANKVLGTG
ncbi:MAG: hypothetical protein JO314_03305, partial [Acidobacteria bacterium]|nr:hypothetical protein [Acidobacteriota bacterium]